MAGCSPGRNCCVAASVDAHLRERAGCVHMLTGATGAVRSEHLRQAIRGWRDAGSTVREGVAPAAPLASIRGALYDALMRAGRLGGRGVPPVAVPLPAAAAREHHREAEEWAQALVGTVQSRPVVVVLDGCPLDRARDAVLLKSLAQALARTATGGALVVNPSDMSSGHLHDTGVHLLPAAIHDAAHRASPEDVEDGSAADVGEPLDPVHLTLMRGLALLGPLTLPELTHLAELGVEDAQGQVAAVIEGLAVRGLVAERAHGLEVADSALQLDLAASVGAAQAAWWRARIAVRRPGRDETAGPTVEGLVVHTPDLSVMTAPSDDQDGSAVVERAARVTGRGLPDAGEWACLAALVWVRRGRVEEAQRWLQHAAETGCDDDLVAYARTQLEALGGRFAGDVSDRRVAEDAYLAGGLGTPPRPLEALPRVFAVHQRLQEELLDLTGGGRGGEVSTDRIRATLDEARSARAVLLWCRAASLARLRRVNPSAGPAGPDGRDDVTAALVSLVAAGRSTVDCARVLSLSTRAVEKRLTTMYRASGTASRAGLVGSHLLQSLRGL